MVAEDIVNQDCCSRVLLNKTVVQLSQVHKIIRAQGSTNMPMDLQSLIILLIVGAIAGWAAGQVVKGYGFGLIGNIVVGVVGAFIGNWLFPQLGLWGADMVGMIISAVLGAIILLVVIGLIRRVA